MSRFNHFRPGQSSDFRPPYLDRGTASRLLDVLLKVPPSAPPARRLEALNEQRHSNPQHKIEVVLATARGALQC